MNAPPSHRASHGDDPRRTKRVTNARQATSDHAPVASPSETTARIPSLFGPYERTAFLVELARLGVARRVDLAQHFGLDMIRTRGRVDRSGLVAACVLPRNRGVAVRLNPNHPLANQVRDLLLALGSGRTPIASTDIRDEETYRLSLSSAPAADPMFLFHTPLRTTVLVTLEALGGEAKLLQLSQCAPGEFYHSVKTVVGKMIKGGVLERDGTTLRFVQGLWTPALRALLRAYLRLDGRTRERIADCRRAERRRRHAYDDYVLLGPKNVQRALVALAVNGPTSFARVMGLSKTSAERGIAVFERMGLIISRKNGRNRTLSLNACHPLYRQFRDLLLSLDGLKRESAACDLKSDAVFGIDNMFGKDLRTAVLLTLRAHHGDEMAAASICRLLPQHDPGTLRKALRAFVKLGVLVRRRWKTSIYYSFDAAYPHYRELRDLLSMAIRHWPSYKSAAEAARFADGYTRGLC